ncbi:MAG: 30S ribosomal protein S5 [Patescibacteria group bacterium]|jgi:small subunit ribosomal protein S5
MIKDDKNIKETAMKIEPAKVADNISSSKDAFSEKGRGRRSFGPKKFGSRSEKPKEEFEQRILEIARVTRVMAGGKRMRFRACVAIGDKKGHVGVGVGKGVDVTLAVNKAVNKAKKEMVDVPMIKDSVPHQIYNKYCAAKILIKPAGKGRGVVAGGAARVIFELAGIRNISSKSLGSSNKISCARCTIEALKKLKRVEQPSAKKEKPGDKEVK